MKGLFGAGLRGGRQPAIGSQGIVVSPSAFATLNGIDVLRAGGNAVDAALAVSASLMVAVPHQCGPGGDAFWIVRPRGGPAVVLNASGRSSARASAATLRDRGLATIGERDGAAVTAPGAMSGWAEVHARFATRELPGLVAPAIAAAERGLVVSPYLARQLAAADDELCRRPSTSAVFRPGGRRLRVGERLPQPDLAATLRALARDPRSIYGGELAARISATVASEGGVLEAEDLARTDADWGAPLSADVIVAGDVPWSVLEVAPNSQGVAALVALAVHRATAGGSPPDDPVAATHRWVESARLAMAVRDATVADPSAMRIEPEALLSSSFALELASRVDPARAMAADLVAEVVGAALARLPGAPVAAALVEGRSGEGSDTAHFCVVDRDGLAVSCIQSLFAAFGTGIVVPGTGILLHCRGSGFTLAEGHPNELGPRKRPMHTLAPAMATAGGDLAAVFGSMGGHAQTQVHLQILDGIAFRALDPATTTARPRWFARRDAATGATALFMESRHRAAPGLAALGHDAHRLGPFDQLVGHAQIVLVDRSRGALLGAADPRSDGLALAY